MGWPENVHLPTVLLRLARLIFQPALDADFVLRDG